MYYTVQSWSKDEIVLLWMDMEDNAYGISLDEVIVEMEKRGCEYIMGYTDLNVAGKVKDGLLYLQEEHKIINKNQKQHMLTGIFLLDRRRQQVILGIIVDHGLGEDFILLKALGRT